MILAVTVCLLIWIFCLLFLNTWKNVGGNGRLPPGPFPLPVLGNLHQIKTGDMAQSLKLLSEKYGPVFTLHFGLRRVVILWGYDAVKEALVDQNDDFGARGALPTFEIILGTGGINTGNGACWKEMRRFAITTLRDLGMGKRSIEEKIREEAQHLIGVFNNTNQTPFDPTFHISNAVANVTCSILFGNRFDYEDKEFRDLLRMINDAFVIASSLYGQIYTMYTGIMCYLPGVRNKLHQHSIDLERFVKRRIEINQETMDPSAPSDFIDHFLIKMEKENQNPTSEYSMKNLIASILGMFLAGTETVSTTIRHAILILLKHPEIKGKVQEEIDRVIGQKRIPSLADRSKMPYTDAVVHEIQRFSDLIPLGVSHKTTRDTKFRGFLIPKDMEVYPILASVHQDSAHYPDPEKFDPARFLNANGSFKKNEHFLPFSAGKRVCPGEGLARMELFIYLTTIVQNFELVFCGDPDKIDTRARLSGFTSIPIEFEVKVIPRQRMWDQLTK